MVDRMRPSTNFLEADRDDSLLIEKKSTAETVEAEGVGGAGADILFFALSFASEGGNKEVDKFGVFSTACSPSASSADGATSDSLDAAEYTTPGRPPPKTLCTGGNVSVAAFFGAGNMDSNADAFEPPSPAPNLGFFSAGPSSSSSS